jgi:hypothetical protein
MLSTLFVSSSRLLGLTSDGRRAWSAAPLPVAISEADVYNPKLKGTADD